MCWCSAKKATYSPHLSISPHYYFTTLSSPSIILPLFLPSSSVEMKDRQGGRGGQALAQLSNHSLSSFFLLPSSDKSSVNRLPALASPLGPWHLSISQSTHTYTHTFPCISLPRHPTPCEEGEINAASSMHHLSHCCPLFNELVWLQLLLLFPPHLSSLVQLTISIFSLNSPASTTTFFLALVQLSGHFFSV